MSVFKNPPTRLSPLFFNFNARTRLNFCLSAVDDLSPFLRTLMAEIKLLFPELLVPVRIVRSDRSKYCHPNRLLKLSIPMFVILCLRFSFDVFLNIMNVDGLKIVILATMFPRASSNTCDIVLYDAYLHTYQCYIF